MSSPANNNLPTLPTSSNSMNPSVRQQRPLNEQPAQHDQRGHSRRAGKPFNRGRAQVRQSINNNTEESAAQPITADVSTDNHSQSNTIQGLIDPTIQDDTFKPSSNKPKGQRLSRGQGGGKYKQRQQLDQLIDGMDGLDIDLAESIAPSSSHGRQSEGGKGRHATVTRKVNLTHLLNYDRKRRGGRQQQSSTNDFARGNHHHPHTYYRDAKTLHKFNKQQFLQANCQFVVLPFHDYSIHKVDPDWPVDWGCIEEVKFRQTGATETTCPICLDPPVAAKITRCGHIYCWTCMLHYLSLSDEKDRPCPICFEPILEEDLRSVVPKLYSNHSVEEEITMQLMFRRKGCVEAEPYKGDEQSLYHTEFSKVDANLLIVDPTTVIEDVIRREQDELMFKLELDHNEPEVCFVEQAIDRLNRRIEELQQMSINSSKIVHNHQDCNLQVESKSEKSFLFYQSSDGQHIYLNPFSTKILCHEYGSLENCPLVIRANILQMDWISMNESWRKRFKYLEHLPLTCEFRMIEIDFEKSNLVSLDTFKIFEAQIKLRANERAFRKTEELKRDKIIQIEQNRKIYGIQPSLEINLDNEEQFPSVIDESRLFHMKPRPESTDLNETSIGRSEQPIGQVLEPEIQTQASLQEPDTALSFKEIQERQAAAESVNPAQTHGARTASKAHARSVQSSFAKLLVNAKSNQKQWTKYSNATTQPASQTSLPSGSGQPRPSSTLTTTINPDGEGEESRAPPCTFTISDFLDAKRSGRRSSKKKIP